MARLCELLLVAGLLLAALLLASPTSATVYTVGGPAGWTTPSRAKVNYTAWAASTPFKVGDSLVFNYVYKAHTVLEVIRSDFRYCNKSNPIAAFDAASGTTTVTLTNPGSYYFIDGVGDHCEEGQKFQASVTGEALAPAPPPPPPPLTSPAPSPSSAKPPATSSAAPLPAAFFSFSAPALLLLLAYAARASLC